MPSRILIVLLSLMEGVCVYGKTFWAPALNRFPFLSLTLMAESLYLMRLFLGTWNQVDSPFLCLNIDSTITWQLTLDSQHHANSHSVSI